MPTVTRLVAQKRDKERVNLYLDGSFAFGLALEEAIHLRIGQELSEAEVEGLRDEDGYHRAYSRSLDYLSRRPRSESELDRYLREREVSEAHRARVIERLRRNGFLDDAAFAQYWIENRETFRPKGAMALRAELRQKGLDETIINQSLAESELDEEEGAYRVARRYVPRLAEITERHLFQQKLAAPLSRRGFSWEVIRSVADRLWDELQSGLPEDD